MKKAFLLLAALLLASSTALAGDDAQIKMEAIPLFQSASVYIDYGSLDASKCELRFKKRGEAAWQEAYPPVVSKDERQARGSVVRLAEDEEYDVKAELFSAAGAKLGEASASFKTWSPKPPIGRTVELPKGVSGPLKIAGVKGSPEAWVKYVAKPGSVVDGGEKEEDAILVENSAYVILEGLRVKGGKINGINVKSSRNVRVLDCEISGWGRVGRQEFSKPKGEWGYGAYYDERGKAINNDAAVFINQSSGTVVERCYAHDPRGKSNSWLYSHPAGPNAIFAREAAQSVVRFNDFIGSDEHRWNDVIEGWGNGKVEGSFYRDAEIYGNFLVFGDDDGIELDGGQMNVRFFDNKIEGCLCGVSVVPNMRGPSYVFNNVVCNLADEDGSFNSAIKSGGGLLTKGRSFIFNNSFSTDGRGIASAGFSNDHVNCLFLCTSRNNVMDCSKSAIADKNASPENDFDCDLMFRRTPGALVSAAKGAEARGIEAKPEFLDAKGGDYRLKPGSRGSGEGVEIPNFAVAAPGGKVEMGAFQQGDSGMSPRRPLPVVWDKACANFALEAKAEASEAGFMTLSVKPGSKWSSKFKVLKNEAFDWLKIEPLEGTLSEESPLKLKLSAEGPKLLKPGVLKGAFIVKMANGLSAPATVYVRTRSDKPETLATLDKFTSLGQFKSAPDKEALSGKALALEKRSGEDCLELSVDIAEEGAYYIYARTKAPSEPLVEHDSLLLSIDGAEPERMDLDGSLSWTWSQLKCGGGARGGGSAYLKAGKHVLKIHPRESILFDALSLSLNPGARGSN